MMDPIKEIDGARRSGTVRQRHAAHLKRLKSLFPGGEGAQAAPVAGDGGATDKDIVGEQGRQRVAGVGGGRGVGEAAKDRAPRSGSGAAASGGQTTPQPSTNTGVADALKLSAATGPPPDVGVSKSDAAGSAIAAGSSVAGSDNSDSVGAEAESLSADEEDTVRSLQARDAEVRAHEAAHLSGAGSAAAGGASYSFQTGPDGKQYAIGGEVPIDMSAASTPEETLTKSQQIRSAALAPADPSGADRSIAAAAGQMETAALRDMAAAAAEAAESARGQGDVDVLPGPDVDAALSSREGAAPIEAPPSSADPRPAPTAAETPLELQSTGGAEEDSDASADGGPITGNKGRRAVMAYRGGRGASTHSAIA